MFGKLQRAGLTVNVDKCQFGVSELVFVGHKLTSEGINPTEDKVEAIAEV